MTQVFDYSLLGDDGQAAADAGLVEATWFKPEISRKRLKALMGRTDRRAIIDTVVWLGLMAGFAALALWQWFSIWSVLALVGYGVLYGSASDSRWHEAGHRTAFRTRWINDVVYQVACFMIMRNPTVWRWSHARHHTDTIIIGRDAEIIAMRPPALGRIGLNVFGVLDAPTALRDMVRYSFGNLPADQATFTPESERPKVFREARLWLLTYVGLAALCLVTSSLLPLVFIGPLPRMYGAWHHLLTGLIQHGGLADNVLDHRLNSRTAYMNRVTRFIYSDMNYHIEHHIFPLVPYHHLEELHHEIKDQLPQPTPSIWAAVKEITPVMIRQRKDPSVYIHRELPTPTAQS